MTDDEAKKYADKILGRPKHGGREEEFVRHALRAMTDREALADIAEEWASSEPDMPSHADTEQRFDSTLESVRKHMRGEE